jgi:hypothetical protein
MNRDNLADSSTHFLHDTGVAGKQRKYVLQKNQKKMVIYSKTIFLQP